MNGAWSAKLRELKRSQTLRNLSYLMGAEVLTRLFRICTTILMARMLSVDNFGLLAIAFTVFELIAVLAHNGFGLYLLKCGADKLARAANTVYLLSWLWAGLMCLLQLLVATVLEKLGQDQAANLVQALAGLHLLSPLALTQVYLIHRGGKLSSFASVSIVQNVTDCLCTIGFLLAGLGVWSVVLARFVSTLMWVVAFRRTRVWRFSPADGFVPPSQAFEYTLAVLVSEYARSIRLWGDNLVVGWVLGTQALGIYYFAKNSGMGISLGISQACVTTLTPRFAQLHRDETAVDHGVARLRLLLTFGGLFTVLVSAQALLAPLYVPVLFGEEWTPAVWVLALLCLSAIPRGIAEFCACLARTSGLSHIEMQWNGVYTIAFLLLVVIVAPLGLIWLATLMIGLNSLMTCWLIQRIWHLLERKTDRSAVEGWST